MSTLHLDEGALRDAVRPFSSVADLRIRPDFPHALRIEVIEHRPVALVQLGASRCRRRGAGCCSRACAPTTCRWSRPRTPAAGDRVQRAARARRAPRRGRRARRARAAVRAPVLRRRRHPPRSGRRAGPRVRRRRRRRRQVEGGRAGARRGLLGGRDSTSICGSPGSSPRAASDRWSRSRSPRRRPRPGPRPGYHPNPLPKAEKEPILDLGSRLWRIAIDLAAGWQL